VVAARPEHLAIGAPAAEALDAKVQMVLPIGPTLVYELKLAGGNTIKVTQPRSHDARRFEVGQQVGVTLRPGSPAGVFVQ
jgi:putative spermidine/putrescine transport system ATP-binding protein